MAIVVPQQEDISLRNRGSRITPVDTYSRPAAPPPADSSVGDALAQFGSLLANTGSEQNKKEEAEQLRNVEYYKSIAGDIADGTPVAAQLDSKLAMVSPTVRARVAESIGYDQGERWWAAQEERLKTNPTFLTNPQALEAEKKRIMQEAGKQFFAGDRATGTGFIKAINGRVNAWESQLSGGRDQLYRQKQEEGMARDVVDRAERAATDGGASSVTGTRYDANPRARPGFGINGATAGGAGVNAVRNTVDKIIGVESSGNPNAKNPRSSATGLGQYISSTWIEAIRRYRPDLAANRSVEQLLALRRDPNISREILTRDVQDYENFLRTRGMAVNEGNLYLVHFAGRGGAEKILKASEGASVASVLGQAAVNANPFMRGWSAGELRQWASRKMGQPYDSTAAARNAVRATDREYGVSSSLDNIYRRNVVSTALQKRAMETGEARYLDYMPKELMTPEVESQFTETRRRVDDLAWQRRQRERQEDEQRKSAEFEQMQTKAIEKIGKGEAIDPYKDSLGPDGRPNPKAFDWLMQRQNINLALNENQSLANRMDLETKITEAEASGDWSKVDPSFIEGRPSEAQFRKFLLERKDLRNDDIKFMLGETPKLLATAASADHREVNEVYTRDLLPMLTMMQGNKVNMAAFNNFNFMSEGRPYYMSLVRSGVRSWLSQNPGNTRVPDHVMQEIATNAVRSTVDRMKEMNEMVQGGMTPDKARMTRQGEMQNQPPPPGQATVNPNTGRPRIEQRVEEDGTITLVPVGNNPTTGGNAQPSGAASVTNPPPAAAAPTPPVVQDTRPMPTADTPVRPPEASPPPAPINMKAVENAVQRVAPGVKVERSTVDKLFWTFRAIRAGRSVEEQQMFELAYPYLYQSKDYLEWSDKLKKASDPADKNIARNKLREIEVQTYMRIYGSQRVN